MSDLIMSGQLSDINRSIQKLGGNKVPLTWYHAVMQQNADLQRKIAVLVVNRDQHEAVSHRLLAERNAERAKVSGLENAIEQWKAAWRENETKRVRQYNDLVDEHEALRTDFNALAVKSNALIDDKKALRSANAELETKCATLRAELDALKKSQNP